MRKFLIILSIIASLFAFALCCNAIDEDFDYMTIEENHESTLPILYINVENKSTARSKLEYRKAYMKLVPNEKYADATLYEGEVGIKARGNSTYHLPKKPYKIKLDTATDLFGFGKSKHWVLLAQYFDESLMRNKLVYDFSGTMGLPYCESVWVDVVFNGEYIGVYQLCEQIRVGEGRVEITDWEEEAETISEAIAAKEGWSKDDRKALEDQMQKNLEWLTTRKVTYNGTEYTIDDYYDLTENTTNGGLIFEISKEYDEESKFMSRKYYPIMIKSPEFANTNEELFQFARQYINAFEEGIFAKDGYTEYEGQEMHYRRLGDMDSLVKTWLCAELFCNRDMTFKSRYMYLDNDGSLLKFGPVWDFDYSAGASTSWGEPGATESIVNNRGENIWYNELFNDPYFAVKASDYYFGYKSGLEEMAADGGLIDTYDTYLGEAGLANTELWKADRGYTRDVAELKGWIKKRIAWLDERFENVDSLLASSGQYRPSNSITVTIYDENGNLMPETIGYDEGCFVVINTELIAKIDMRVYVNGIYIGDAIRMENKNYAIYVDAEYLDEISGNRNVINVWCYRGERFFEANYECVVKETPEPWYIRCSNLMDIPE